MKHINIKKFICCSHVKLDMNGMFQQQNSDYKYYIALERVDIRGFSPILIPNMESRKVILDLFKTLLERNILDNSYLSNYNIDKLICSLKGYANNK